MSASILQLHILHSGTPPSIWRIYISASILQLHILHSRHSSIYIENIYISLNPAAAYTAFQAILHLYREYINISASIFQLHILHSRHSSIYIKKIYINLHPPATYTSFQTLLHLYREYIYINLHPSRYINSIPGTPPSI